MRAAKSARRFGITLLMVLAAVALVSSAVYAAAAAAVRPGITLQISPTSQSVERGKAATYTVTLSSAGGFAGSVSLRANGLPSATTAGFAPAAVSLSASGTGSTATSVLTVTTTSSTPVGTFTFTVTGTSGQVSGSVSAGLTVNYPVSGSLSMNATPGSVTMSAGSVAVYAVQLARTGISGDVTLNLYGGLPGGATWAFSPNPTTGNSSTLQVTTSATTADGTFTLYLAASGKDASGTTRYAYASVQLVISTSARPFTISGNLGGLLAPGTSLPLDLSVTNPNAKSLSVTNLSVTIQKVTRTPSATNNNLPCGTGDYAVAQYSGPYPLVVPGSSTRTLSGLGVQAVNMPQVKLLNTTLNQDGCKGATLTLVYAGSGQGN